MLALTSVGAGESSSLCLGCHIRCHLNRFQDRKLVKERDEMQESVSRSSRQTNCRGVGEGSARITSRHAARGAKWKISLAAPLPQAACVKTWSIVVTVLSHPPLSTCRKRRAQSMCHESTRIKLSIELEFQDVRILPSGSPIS